MCVDGLLNRSGSVVLGQFQTPMGQHFPSWCPTAQRIQLDDVFPFRGIPFSLYAAVYVGRFLDQITNMGWAQGWAQGKRAVSH